MTHEHVSNFTHELLTMAKAMDELPIVKHELHTVGKLAEERQITIQALELRIMDLKNEAESLRGHIRELEVSRDDAELRFLEAEDRTDKALAFIRSVFGNAGTLIQALEPPKPQAQVDLPPEAGVPTDLPGASQGQDEPITPAAADAKRVPITDSAPPTPADSAPLPSSSGLDQGVSVPTGPTAPAASPDTGVSAESIGAEPIASASPSTTTGSSAEEVSVPVDPTSTPGPYSGKRYIQVRGWISRADWLAGGGTEADYDWREGQVA